MGSTASVPKSPLPRDLVGKVILVTGGSDGIGRSAATTFAKRGATVTIVGRNQEKTAKVVEEIKQESDNQNIDCLIGDLSRMADVRRIAAEFKSSRSRLDVLVNNAGASFKNPLPGPDGFELTFALNHLGYFQMTVALLDLLQRTVGARVVSTSSSMQGQGKIDLDKIATSLEGWGPNAYAASKLANILFTKELQRRVGDAISVNCFEPGMVRTQFGAMGSDQGALLNFIYWCAKPFAITPEQGADSLVWLATAEESRALHGEYVSKRKPIKPNKIALDQQLAADLWTLSERLCEQTRTPSEIAAAQ